MLSHFSHDSAESLFELIVVNVWLEWDVQREILTLTAAYVHKVTRSREEIVTIAMEADRHDPICGVKGFFDAIPMMNIYVDI